MRTDSNLETNYEKRLAAYNRIERKHSFIQWLSGERKAWRELLGHDGELNSVERNESFNEWLEGV